MKAFSEFEKTVLNKVLSYHERSITPNVASILDAYLVHKSITLDYTTGQVQICLDGTVFGLDGIVEETRKTTRELVTAISFLAYLQESGYLMLYNEGALPSHFEYGQRIKKNLVVTNELHDERIKNLFFQTSFQTIMVTQSLVDYVANDYQTPEELHNKAERADSQKNLRIAARSLVINVAISAISVTLAVVSIMYAVKEVGYAKMQVEQDQNVRLVDSQAKAMEKAFTDITVQLDSVTRKLDSLLAHTPPSQTAKPAGVGKGKPVTPKKGNNKRPVPANSATAE